MDRTRALAALDVVVNHGVNQQARTCRGGTCTATSRGCRGAQSLPRPLRGARGILRPPSRRAAGAGRRVGFVCVSGAHEDGRLRAVQRCSLWRKGGRGGSARREGRGVWSSHARRLRQGGRETRDASKLAQVREPPNAEVRGDWDSGRRYRRWRARCRQRLAEMEPLRVQS
jgi:hypothetical protein